MKKLSRAGELNVNTIHSIMEEKVSAPVSLLSVPYDLGDKQYTSFAESIADLKNNDKDCSCTPDQFLAEE